MKIFYRTSLPSLFAMLFVLASCSPEYGAHFAPSKQSPSVAIQEKAEAAAPLVAEEPAEVTVIEEKRAEEAGATAVIPQISVPAEAPAVKPMTAREQKQMIREFRSKLKGMTKEERQVFQNQVLRQLKEQQLGMKVSEDVQREPGRGNVNPVLLTIVTIFIPPLGVFLHQGEINSKFWISLVLTLLFYVPGLIYSLLVIFNVI